MARKRKIKSHLRGTGRKKMKMTRTSRKYRTGRTRLMPEVKFTNKVTAGLLIRHREAASSVLSGNSFINLINWPAQGTTDTNRIGDTIMGKKLYIRFTIFANDTQLTKTSLVRIIIWNHKEEKAPGTDVTGFFQLAVDRPALNGIVNREVINKVFYDKTFVLRGTRATDNYVHKPINVNISMKWPVLFAGGAVSPKDLRNDIKFGVIGYNQGGTEGAGMAFVDVNPNFYYTDS